MIECDAGDADFGAVTFVEGLAAAFSTLLAALLGIVALVCALFDQYELII